MHQAPAPSTKASLIVMIAESDNSAWRCFVKLYTPYINKICRQSGLQSADCENVSQEVFLRIKRAVRNFHYDPAVGRFRGWLKVIVQREIWRYQGKLHRTPSLPPEFDVESAPSGGQGNIRDVVIECIFQLAMEEVAGMVQPKTMQIFEKVWVQERSSRDVAAEMGMPVQLVYQAKSSVLQKMQKIVRRLAQDAAFDL